MGHSHPPPLEHGNIAPEKPEDKLAQKVNDSLQSDVAKQGFEVLNSEVVQQNQQEKLDRNVTLDQQLQNGKAKMTPISRQFGCRIELKDGDQVVVRGRSNEEVSRAKEAEEGKTYTPKEQQLLAEDPQVVNMLREIVDLFTCKANGAELPELYRIAWDSYLTALAVNSDAPFDRDDYVELRDQGFFPSFSTDPECNDPVLAISIGKHYQEHDPSIPEGECLYETEFEGLSRKIGQDTKHLGGQLTPGFTVAWAGKLLGLHDCNEITDQEYEQLKAMLPELEGNPVEEVEALTRKYLEANRHQVPPA